MSTLRDINALAPPGPAERRFFYAYAIFTLLCLGGAIVAEAWYLLGLPVVLWVMAQAFLDFRPLFWLLILCIPVSTNVTFGGFGTDLPTEPLAIGLTGLLLLHAAKHWPAYERARFGHPIAWLLYAHVGWILFATLCSDGFVISLKFSLAKLWYVGAYFLVPKLGQGKLEADHEAVTA
ncbi:MAG: hypothetical protein AAFN92_08875, partial [Bacteroidota bacterium]